MITRVARNDVVRVIKTGEVGLIKGWADHEKLAQNGTILDVELSIGRTIQVNGLALEFVASAKLKNSLWAQWLVILVSMSLASYIGWLVAQEGVRVAIAVMLGSLVYPSLDRTLTSMFLRKKTRISVPVKTVPHPSVRVKGSGNITAGRDIKY